MVDYMIGGVLLALLIFTVVKMVKRSKKGAGCGACSACAKKPYDECAGCSLHNTPAKK